jgi:hypothetical protein
MDWKWLKTTCLYDDEGGTGSGGDGDAGDAGDAGGDAGDKGAAADEGGDGDGGEPTPPPKKFGMPKGISDIFTPRGDSGGEPPRRQTPEPPPVKQEPEPPPPELPPMPTEEEWTTDPGAASRKLNARNEAMFEHRMAPILKKNEELEKTVKDLKSGRDTEEVAAAKATIANCFDNLSNGFEKVLPQIDGYRNSPEIQEEVGELVTFYVQDAFNRGDARALDQINERFIIDAYNIVKGRHENAGERLNIDGAELVGPQGDRKTDRLVSTEDRQALKSAAEDGWKYTEEDLAAARKKRPASQR